ncbi:MAG TPA: recombinase family protein [Candidatus Saccharibacteria bacterium]|nr:recombinase family protein [Candidatus Saccharibacteria bacterium]HRK94418.1 recombinase family protein [Candidatus Saccharibacteria bacterium]
MADHANPQKLLELLQAGQPKAPGDVDTDTLRYALYVRKSTTSEDRQASSIEDQIQECMEKVVIPNNLNVVKVYEESFSAKVADTRIKFNALINEIENGHIDGLIAWHPDRLSRNMKEAGAIIDLVDRGLIKDLRFPTFTFENTPAGKMLLGITFVMAKQYSEHLAESVDRGNKRAIEDGEFIGKFKHGYVVDEKRNFQPDPRGFAAVKNMFTMALEGKSQKDIRLWINNQSYAVQKRLGGEYVKHVWDKDDVSKLLRDPHYVGIHKWGKTLINLVEKYDFEPMITVDEFLKINRIDSLNASKVLAIHSPRPHAKADLLRGMIYCGECDKTLTSMLIPKRDKETGEIMHARYYYKCETVGCKMFDKSARAGLVIDAAKKFFGQYLFVTKSNYAAFVSEAKKEAKRRQEELDSEIAKYKVLIANKEKSYIRIKDLILESPELKEHYDLSKYAKDIESSKADYAKAIRRRDRIKGAIPTFEEYLKLLETTPVILDKIQDMKVMDTLLRIFFSNFTITPGDDSFRKGSAVSYKLKEPWEGFVSANDFVRGAG